MVYMCMRKNYSVHRGRRKSEMPVQYFGVGTMSLEHAAVEQDFFTGWCFEQVFATGYTPGCTMKRYLHRDQI